MSNVFIRINRLFNANINDMLDRIEDPERMSKQIIREMEINVQQVKDSVVDAIASEKRLGQEVKTQREQAAVWQQKATLALTHGQDELARSALLQKKDIEANLVHLEPAWQQAQATSRRLKAQLQKLETKLAEVKRKRSTLVARQRASQARTQICDSLSGIDMGLAQHACFDRLSDQVAEMEARTAALEELDGTDSELEQAFVELEVNQDIEAELVALKAKIEQC